MGKKNGLPTYSLQGHRVRPPPARAESSGATGVEPDRGEFQLDLVGAELGAVS